MAEPAGPPEPPRVRAGRRNRALRVGLTPGGRERLREAARAGRPWEHATGPRTAEGKARSAANGRAGQSGEASARGLRAELAGVRALLARMREARRHLAPAPGPRADDDRPIAAEGAPEA